MNKIVRSAASKKRSQLTKALLYPPTLFRISLSATAASATPVSFTKHVSTITRSPMNFALTAAISSAKAIQRR